MIDIRIQSNEFDFGQEVKNFQNNQIDGAVVCFLGSVRDLEPKETLEKLEIEYYPKMAKKVLKETAKKAFKKWSLSQCLVIHRFGELEVSEPIVLVITQTKHRKDAFKANEYIIDFLKINAPFWKKEHSPKGAKWVKQNKRDLEINF